MIMGGILTREAAEKVNTILADEGFAAVLKHLAFYARLEMDIGLGDDVAKVLITLANRLIRGADVSR